VRRDLVELTHAFQEARVPEGAAREGLGAGRELVEGDLQRLRETDGGVELGQALSLFITGDLHVIELQESGKLADGESQPLAEGGKTSTKLSTLHHLPFSEIAEKCFENDVNLSDLAEDLIDSDDVFSQIAENSAILTPFSARSLTTEAARVTYPSSFTFLQLRSRARS